MIHRKIRTEKTAKKLFLEQTEAFALQHGREIVRKSLETVTQEQVEKHEKKRNFARNAKPKNAIAVTKAKKSATAVGSIKLKRKYAECLPCQLQGCDADQRTGESSYTKGAGRLAVLAVEAIADVLGLKAP